MFRKAILLFLVFLPLLLLAQNAYLPFTTQHTSLNYDRDNQREWRSDYMISSTWDGTVFNADTKTEVTYYQYHPTAPQHINGYSWSSNQWWPDNQLTYIYGDSYEFITEADFNNNINGPLTPYLRYLYTYDEQGRLSLIVTQQYSPTTFHWSDYKRLHFIYDNGYLVQTVEWAYLYSAVYYARFEFAYNANNKLDTSTYSACTDSSTWINTSRKQYTYNTHDTSDNEGLISYYAHAYPIIYPLEQNSIPGYSSYAMPEEIIDTVWLNSSWYEVEHSYYSYDYYTNKVTEFLSENGNPNWINDKRWTMTYDTNTNPVFQTFMDYAPFDWFNTSRISYFWEDSSPNDDQIAPALSEISLKVYPSPFQNTLQVNTTSKQTKPVTLQLFNTKGQCVQKHTTQPNQQISLDGNTLPSGVYLLKATQGTSSETRKVIKIK